MPQESELERQWERAADIVAKAKYVVALVGAGMSVESGIPPFRGPNGIWTKYGEPNMRGYERFLADPRAWWQERLSEKGYMADFRRAMQAAKPNLGHLALAQLEAMGVLKYIITQNVDNLHQRAGSTRVAEIHGNTFKLRCISCTARFEREQITIEANMLPPRCPECAGILKTDSVMFGEPIPPDVLEICQRVSYLCDCMLLIGTSAVVYPAASFPALARSRGAYLIEINTMETAISYACDVVIRAPSGEALPKLVERVKERLAKLP